MRVSVCLIVCALAFLAITVVAGEHQTESNSNGIRNRLTSRGLLSVSSMESDRVLLDSSSTVWVDAPKKKAQAPSPAPAPKKAAPPKKKAAPKPKKKAAPKPKNKVQKKKPVAKKPKAKKPKAKKPAAKKPKAQKPKAKKSAPKKPVKAKKPIAKKPVAKKPVARKPKAKKPVARKPIAKKAKARKPIAKKPVAKKPVAKKPVAKKQPKVAKKPAVKKPAVKKPAKKPVKKLSVDTSGGYADMLSRKLSSQCEKFPNTPKCKADKAKRDALKADEDALSTKYAKQSKDAKEKAKKDAKRELNNPARRGLSCPVSFSLLETQHNVNAAPALTPAEVDYCNKARAKYFAKNPKLQADGNVASPAAYTPVKGPHSMTVADLPLNAKLDMTMNDVSYRVKNLQAEAKKKHETSAQLWNEEIQKEADHFKGSELEAPLRNMKVIKSNFDQAVVSTPGSQPGKQQLYVGGHGSDSKDDWIGQNLQLSAIPQAARGLADKIGNKLGVKNLADKLHIPDIEMRGKRLLDTTNDVLADPQYKGKIEKINVFGHSMSGLQDHKTAEALTKQHKDIPTEAYLLNPGGIGKLDPESNIHHVVQPGEVLQKVGLGGGDNNQINVIPKNIDAKKASGLAGSVYLHSNDRVMDDIREFEKIDNDRMNPTQELDKKQGKKIAG